MECPKCNSNEVFCDDIEGSISKGYVLEEWWCNKCGYGWRIKAGLIYLGLSDDINTVNEFIDDKWTTEA